MSWLAAGRVKCTRRIGERLPGLVIPCHTWLVKTAISVPDVVYERVERKAQQLGWSRSQFYASAAEQLLDRLDRESVAAAIDAALDLGAGSDESTDIAVVAGRRTLGSTQW